MKKYVPDEIPTRDLRSVVNERSRVRPGSNPSKGKVHFNVSKIVTFSYCAFGTYRRIKFLDPFLAKMFIDLDLKFQSQIRWKMTLDESSPYF